MSRMKSVKQDLTNALFLMKEKKHGSGDGAQDLGTATAAAGSSVGQSGQTGQGQQKTVTVEVGGKKKKTGGTSKSKSSSSASLDLSREFSKCKDDGRTRLNLSKSNISAIPSNVSQLNQLVELYLYSNRLSTLPPEIGSLTK